MMLMITVETEPAVVTLRLKGQLAGPEARELMKGWRDDTLKQPHQTVLFDLTGVTWIDRVGRDFLARAHRNGGTLVGGAATRSIVDEILAGTVVENSIG
jgi:hypothetical protein